MKNIWILLFVIFFPTCTLQKQAGKQQNVPYTRAELKKRTFNFFWHAIDSNFQTLDRFPSKTFSSIAATGFGLSSYLVGIENRYITRKQGAQRVVLTLRTLWNLPQGSGDIGTSGHKGFYYHFLRLDDAHRYKKVELSSIDTGLLMAGVLSCMSYFDKNDPIEIEIRRLADQLYRRVEWDWMMKANGFMSMGWHPENGFISSQWSGYNEAMILLIMAMGSPTHPIAHDSWSKWCSTYERETFYGYKNVQFDPLFGHQYSHVWIDFRGIRDSFMRVNNDDYFENSKKATLANRAYCIANPMQWKGYHKDQWGLTACDGVAHKKLILDGVERQFFDYRARGAASTKVLDDGTIAPTASGGSFAFTPVESESCLKYMWETHYPNLIGQFGFKDAFNLTYQDANHPNGWFDIDYLGIDQGTLLLMIENYESQMLWKVMKKNPYIVAGLKRAGFTGGWLNSIKN